MPTKVTETRLNIKYLTDLCIGQRESGELAKANEAEGIPIVNYMHGLGLETLIEIVHEAKKLAKIPTPLQNGDYKNVDQVLRVVIPRGVTKKEYYDVVDYNYETLKYVGHQIFTLEEVEKL